VKIEDTYTHTHTGYFDVGINGVGGQLLGHRMQGGI